MYLKISSTSSLPVVAITCNAPTDFTPHLILGVYLKISSTSALLVNHQRYNTKKHHHFRRR